LDGEIQWPSAVERLHLRGTLWDFPASDVLCPIFLLDGVIQKTSKPHDSTEALMYCSRKRTHGFNHQIICRWDGKIVAVYPGFFGSTHDSACFKLTELHSARGNFFSDNETMIADCGYQDCGILNVRKAPLDVAGRALNRLLRRHRVLIEFVIGGVKQKFQLVQSIWKHRRSAASDAFFVACQLFNYWMRKYGYLRGAAYQQRHELEEWEAKLLRLAGQHVWDAEECIFDLLLADQANDLLAMFKDRGVI